MPNQLEITNYGFPVEVVRSSRKTISVEITRDCRVVVRAPKRLSRSDISYFINEKHKWIERHLEQMRRRVGDEQPEKLTPGEIEELKARALPMITQRLRRFVPILGVDYGRVALRCQTSRWGSCSAKGNLNFNCLLALTPPEVVDYVVVHELCHRREMNHSPRFWAEVAGVLPDYAAGRRWLKEHGAALISRIR